MGCTSWKEKKGVKTALLRTARQKESDAILSSLESATPAPGESIRDRIRGLAIRQSLGRAGALEKPEISEKVRGLVNARDVDQTEMNSPC